MNSKSATSVNRKLLERMLKVTSSVHGLFLFIYLFIEIHQTAHVIFPILVHQLVQN